MPRKLFNISWVKILLLTLLTMPFIILWGELFTRVLLPQNLDTKKDFFAVDPVIGFIHKPNAIGYEKGREYNARYEINSIGLRDREYGPKEADAFRVLLLGDSFCVSHGLQIEESISRQLENALQKLVNEDGKSIKIEVVNVAAGGYSTYNYWKAYQRWKPVVKPDIVVAGISPDDYDSNNAGLNYLIEDGIILETYKGNKIPDRSKGNVIIKIRKWLSWNSQLYVLLRNYFYYSDVGGSLSLWMQAKGEEIKNQLQQYVVPQPEEMTRAWEKSLSYLAELNKECFQDNLKLVVIPIPLKEEIDSVVRKRTLQASDLTEGQINMDQPLRVIKSFCNKNDIPLLDPRPALKQLNERTPAYFVYDGHWNAKGVQFAAEYLAQLWRNYNIPPWK